MPVEKGANRDRVGVSAVAPAFYPTTPQQGCACAIVYSLKGIIIHVCFSLRDRSAWSSSLVVHSVPRQRSALKSLTASIK